MRIRLLVFCAAVGLSAVSASASTFTVININDSGTGSLRQAITDANNNAGLDTIAFSIPGSGVHTITPLSPLPVISDSVVIDGYTQPGASANTLANGDNAALKIELNGTNFAGIDANGLVLAGGATTVRGLVINRCQFYGIFIQTSGHFITGNFIGTNPTGTMALPNGQGVQVASLNFSSPTNNTIGGSTPAERNVLSGNVSAGVDISGGAATGNVVKGNFIGTDATGTKAVPNDIGISVLNAASTTIGGTVAGVRNVVSANTEFGIDINGGGGGHIVQGNFIGVDVTGAGALGNGTFGIECDAPNDLIGGTTAGAGNIIAFNGAGSGQGCGIEMIVGSAIGNAILGNSIFANTSKGTTAGRGLGIDLGLDGVTLNDVGDADSGPNNLQNFPVIKSVTNSGGMTTITGTLNSIANTTYRIEFFANDAIDPTGYGEGQTFIGFKDVTTNGSGNVSFNASFTQIGAEQRVTATATDPNNNSSEFSGSIGQLLNISTRMEVLTGSSVLIGGFIISGPGNKQVLLRALGPTLSQFGINGVLPDPTLELHDGGGALIASNDNWKDTQQAAIAATGLAPPNDLESAILHTFTAGNHTAIVRGKNNITGIGLVEGYDIDKAVATTLTNISTRGFVDTGQNVMIGGLISGNGITRVIVRALGPTLSQFGVTNVLADPTLELHDGNGTLLASNDNWADTQQAEIQASGFAPPNMLESAIIAVRPGGNSTAIVSGKNNTTGNALVEVYTLPP